MFFYGAPDDDLFGMTGSFPATRRREKDTHPLFVLKNLSTGHLVCPCSSKGRPRDKRYIRSGCPLELKKDTTSVRSYLVEACCFTLPLDTSFSRKLIFGGLVPSSCIVDERRKNGA